MSQSKKTPRVVVLSASALFVRSYQSLIWDCRTGLQARPEIKRTGLETRPTKWPKPKFKVERALVLLGHGRIVRDEVIGVPHVEQVAAGLNPLPAKEIVVPFVAADEVID